MESDSDFFGFMDLIKELVTDNRPLRLRLDLPGGENADMLLPQRVFGAEAICGGIEYRVLCVSANAQLPLKEMIAVAATLEFVTDRGELRSVSGIVTEASSGDSDGGLASYQVVLRDALAILEKRTNTRVFRGMDEVEIVQRILNEWRQKSPVLGSCFNHEVDQTFSQRGYPKREFTMQHNESDAAFIRRLLKRRGIGWYIRSQDMTHTLVLFNSADSLHQNAAGTIRYHRDSATEERDTITSWSAVRSLQAGSVTRHSWDYMNPQGRDFMMVEASSGIDQGISGNELAASLDDYQILAPHAGDDNEDLCRLGQLCMNRHDYESKCFHGEGSVRDLCAGEYFTLAEHPEVDEHPLKDRDFVVTALQVMAQNNLPKTLSARVERLFARSRWMHGALDMHMLPDMAEKMSTGPMRMHIQFTAVRRGVTIVPAFDPRSDVPQAQMQSAIVTGPEGEEVHCDQLGRVKIRFPGTRMSDHEQAAGSGASDSETDSAWVRVASNWAGNGPGSFQQCGTIGLPRVGTEVLIAFLGGDPDKPIIVGQLYNQRAQPPALGVLDSLSEGRYLSGIKSREIQGSRSNQVRFDDTPGRINAQVSSDHGCSQLNLGFLIRPKNSDDSEPRGEGAELRSDRSVSIRGGRGVLISASAQADASGALLHREELSSVAEVSQHIAKELSTLAEKHAEDKSDDSQLIKLVDRIKKWDGEEQNLIAGQPEPIVVVTAPSGAFIGSQDSIALCAESSINLVSITDTCIDAGRDLLLRAMQGISLFAVKLGIKLIAASGNIKIQSQNGDIEITSAKRIKLIANEGIELQSPIIKLVAQGCQINYAEGAIIQQSRGVHIIKSSKFCHENGGDGDSEKINLPKSEINHDQQVLVTDLISGEPISERRYRIILEDGKTIEGTTDVAGLTERFSTNIAFAQYEIELLD